MWKVWTDRLVNLPLIGLMTIWILTSAVMMVCWAGSVQIWNLYCTDPGSVVYISYPAMGRSTFLIGHITIDR